MLEFSASVPTPTCARWMWPSRPDGWDGKDWSKVKRVDLRGRNLAFADATRAFLANADLRGRTSR